MVTLPQMNSKAISLRTKTWQVRGLIFLFNTGTEEMEINLVIINGEMAYRQMTAKAAEEVDKEDIKDILNPKTMDRNLYKTIPGDSNWNL